MAKKSTSISVELDGSKLELKGIKVYYEMSEETIAFTAKAYFNGKYIGCAKNEGVGGDSYISGEHNEELLNFFKTISSLFAERVSVRDKEFFIDVDEDLLLSNMVYQADVYGKKSYVLNNEKNIVLKSL